LREPKQQVAAHFFEIVYTIFHFDFAPFEFGKSVKAKPKASFTPCCPPYSALHGA
jgi:hypothetical protein